MLKKHTQNTKPKPLKKTTKQKTKTMKTAKVKKTTPNKSPRIVPKKPTNPPEKKKILNMLAFLNPRDRRIASSIVLLRTKIIKLERMLKAATNIISVNIINITFLSTIKASKKVL